MNNWDDFKDDVQAVLGKRVTNQAIAMPSVSSVKPNIWLMGLLILAISLGLTIMFSDSGTNLQKQEIAIPSVAAQESTQENLPKTKETPNLQRQIDVLSTKVRILGSISNNNWQSYNGRVPSTDLVFLERDWKLSQMPARLQKTEDENKFFQEWVRGE